MPLAWSATPHNTELIWDVKGPTSPFRRALFGDIHLRVGWVGRYHKWTDILFHTLDIAG